MILTASRLAVVCDWTGEGQVSFSATVLMQLIIFKSKLEADENYESAT